MPDGMLHGLLIGMVAWSVAYGFNRIWLWLKTMVS